MKKLFLYLSVILFPIIIPVFAGALSWTETLQWTTLAPDGNTLAMSASIPEPASLFLLGAGLIGFAGMRKNRIKN